MEVIFKNSFIKELKILPKPIQLQVQDLIEKIITSKNLKDSNIDYLKLGGQKNTENYYRIRLGNYRIGCEYITPKMLLITIVKRNDMYKKFPPK